MPVSSLLPYDKSTPTPVPSLPIDEEYLVTGAIEQLVMINIDINNRYFFKNTSFWQGYHMSTFCQYVLGKFHVKINAYVFKAAISRQGCRSHNRARNILPLPLCHSGSINRAPTGRETNLATPEGKIYTSWACPACHM